MTATATTAASAQLRRWVAAARSPSRSSRWAPRRAPARESSSSGAMEEPDSHPAVAAAPRPAMAPRRRSFRDSRHPPGFLGGGADQGSSMRRWRVLLAVRDSLLGGSVTRRRGAGARVEPRAGGVGRGPAGALPGAQSPPLPAVLPTASQREGDTTLRGRRCCRGALLQHPLLWPDAARGRRRSTAARSRRRRSSTRRTAPARALPRWYSSSARTRKR